jgi:hypoxanthine-guanine phosphoribosyltransferase
MSCVRGSEEQGPLVFLGVLNRCRRRACRVPCKAVSVHSAVMQRGCYIHLTAQQSCKASQQQIQAAAATAASCIKHQQRLKVLMIRVSNMCIMYKVVTLTSALTAPQNYCRNEMLNASSYVHATIFMLRCSSVLTAAAAATRCCLFVCGVLDGGVSLGGSISQL